MNWTPLARTTPDAALACDRLARPRATASRRAILALATLATLAGLPLAGCDNGPRTLTIGVLVAQTGTSGARGKDLLNGATLAAEEINKSNITVDGKPLHVDIKASDDRGEVEAAATQARDLVDTGISAMIGPINSNQAAAVIPIVAAKGLPQLITATSASLLSLGQGNALRLLANDDQQGRAIAGFAAENLHAQRIAIVMEKSDYGHGLKSSVEATLAKHALTPVATAEIDEKAPLPEGLVAQFRAAKADTIVFLAREPQLLALVDGLAKAGWTDVNIVGTNVVRNQSVARRGLPITTLYATATAIDAKEFPQGKEFLESFKKRFGGDPVWGAQYAYDAVYALADAAHQGRSLAPADLVATLKRIEPATKVNQQMRFSASGEQVYPAIGVYKLDREAWTLQMMSANW